MKNKKTGTLNTSAEQHNSFDKNFNTVLENYKEKIKILHYSVLASKGILQNARKRGYVCPICGNGNGEDGTGIEEHIEINGIITSHCLKCDESFDNIKFLALHYGLSEKFDFVEIIKRGATSLLSESINDKFSDTAKKDTSSIIAYSRLAESRNHLSNLFSNREIWRGLPQNVLKKLNWGFLQDYSHPKKQFEVFPAVIIPNIKGGILAREVDCERKSNIAPAAPTIIFLPEGNDFILTISEGAINAASLAFATDFKYPVIATGGTSGVDSVLEFLLKKYPSNKPKINIQFDNDSNGAGKKAADILLRRLKKQKLSNKRRFQKKQFFVQK